MHAAAMQAAWGPARTFAYGHNHCRLFGDEKCNYRTCHVRLTAHRARSNQAPARGRPIKAVVPTTHLAILSSGGLRSLVATALAMQGPEKVRVTLIHILDGRDNAVTRLAYVRQQAEALGITRVSEIDLPHVFGGGQGVDAEGRPIGTLVGPQRLMAGIAHARQAQAQRLTWPMSADGDVKAIGRATEQMVLCGHLCDLEGVPMPAIDAPLLEYTDQQIIELGGQLGTSWHLAWSCLGSGERPCRSCAGCRRRAAAFDEAGVLDPAATAGLSQHRAGAAQGTR